MPECNFFVGQKVVCIKRFVDNDDIETVSVGTVYTVRWVGTHPWMSHEPGFDPDLVCVRLEEVYRPPLELDFEEVGMAHYHFRPATDISSLEALLQSNPVKEPA